MNTNLIPKYVEDFFKSCEIDNRFKRLSFFVIRQDGVVLYHNNSMNNSVNKSSIGALISGVWQASKALSEFIPNNASAEEYRLSFDTSSQGIYVIPMTGFKEDLFLGAIYHNEINPGLVKNKLREISFGFSQYLAHETKKVTEPKKDSLEKSKSDFLFSDISDAEMDKLFSFIKN